MRYFCNVMPSLVAALIINDCDGYRTLRITDYYWQARSVYEWIPDVYSNDCFFFNMFIENYLIPMNMQIVNSSTNASVIEDYFECDDSRPDSVGRAHDRCEGWPVWSWSWYSDCDAYQHYMFEVSKNSTYYNDVKNDSIVDSLLHRKFVHFTMLYDTNTTEKVTTDLALILNNTNNISDYQSYLTSIENYSQKSMYTDNNIHNMSWKLITTRMSMVLGYKIDDINIAQLSQQCNLIYFNWIYNSAGECHGLFTVENVTSNSYLQSTQFMDANKTVKCDYCL